jgi:hypothetical protein
MLYILHLLMTLKKENFILLKNYKPSKRELQI